MATVTADPDHFLYLVSIQKHVFFYDTVIPAYAGIQRIQRHSGFRLPVRARDKLCRNDNDCRFWMDTI
ncbi:MAG: hypothetical protein V3R68_06600 [Gammaproteobacteria bacterium]|jgi:hypothetical protein